MKILYRMTYKHTDPNRPEPVRTRNVRWTTFGEVQRILKTLIQDPKVSDIEITQRKTARMSLHRFLSPEEQKLVKKES